MILCLFWHCNDLFALLMLLISLKSCIIHSCVYIVMDCDSNPHIKRESLRYKWDDNGFSGAAGGLIFSLFAESVCLCVCVCLRINDILLCTLCVLVFQQHPSGPMRRKYSSCSTIFLDDSTVSQPNLKYTIKWYSNP